MKALHETTLGQNVYVRMITHTPMMKRRLHDLGFTKGSRICPLLQSPTGYIRAYQVKGCCIALRDTDAAHIQVEEVFDASRE